MTDGRNGPIEPGAEGRVGRFFTALTNHPRFVVPTLLLTACTLLYVEVAVRKAFPYVVPALLDRAIVPESELRANLHRAFRTAALVLPPLAVPLTAFVAGACLAPFRSRPPFARVFPLVAHASLWVAAGLVVKTLLVIATGQPDPPVNLGAFVRAEGAGARAVLALTNPFGVLAILTTFVGLRAIGASRGAAAVAGSAPWILWMGGFALVFGGPARLTPDAPVSTDDWPEISRGSLTLRYPPGMEAGAATLLGLAVPFSERIEARLGLDPEPLRIHVFPDHATLERATGEILHVLVTGSIRGADLLYLEMPGHSAAMTREHALREALRWIGLVRLAPAASAAPRWFVEGFVHATVHPGDAALDREFRAALGRFGVPTYARMIEPGFFRTPEGPLFARSLVDHVAFLNGPEAPERIMRAIIAGKPFRDALFEYTRLTTSALELGWTEALEAVARQEGVGEVESPDTSSGRRNDAVPFLREP